MEELLGKFCEEYSFVDVEWKEENGRKLLYTDRGLHYIHTCPPSYRAKGFLVEKAIEAIHKNCDLKVLPICKANDDNYHMKDGEVLYYLQEGMRETTWERHYFNLGRSLAEFHQSTRTLSWDKLYLPYRSLGTWPEMWEKKCKTYESLLDSLERSKAFNPFEVYLFTMFTYIQVSASTAIDYLNGNGYKRLTNAISKQGKIAFQNFQDGHILFHESGKRYIAGQYSWVLDMRTRDIGQGIKWIVRKNGWQEDKVIEFLVGYQCIAQLYPEEYCFIFAMLLYPSRFLKTVEIYSLMGDEERTLAGEDWQTPLDEELATMEQVLGQYPEAIRQYFGVEIPEIHWLWRLPEDDNKTICICDTESSGGSYEPFSDYSDC
ncbi:hypothetical protein [Brevibacillus laterosporus]|uniref:Spore coat protein YutH n=1 Tax=Brevibacillus laterosporus TaxID=1465 RepID=A0A0F7EET5_BRELA|nr:hypothetical protein EX87_03510 [Brevibacillus laterosporus]